MHTHDTIHFARQFLRNPATVGAVSPASRAMAHTMVGDLEFGPDDPVLEFGPGTGPFTREIEAILPDPANYLGIEFERRFVDMLNRRFPSMRFVHGSAEDAVAYCREVGLNPPKAIISGLPFASLPLGMQDRIMEAIDALLTPGAEFRSFQYAHSYPLPNALRFRARMRKRFGPYTRSPLVYRNFPPAYVLTWRR